MEAEGKGWDAEKLQAVVQELRQAQELTVAQLGRLKDWCSRLEQDIAALQRRLAVNPGQRNCPRCGRMAITTGGRCGVCGASLEGK